MSIPTLFTILLSDLYPKRRQEVSKFLSHSFLQRNSDLIELAKSVTFTRFLPIIDKSAATQDPLNITEINDAVAVDCSPGFVLGSRIGTNLLRNPGFRKDFLTYHHQERSYGFWPQEPPLLTAIFSVLGILNVSNTVITASKRLESLSLASFRTLRLDFRIDEKPSRYTQAGMCSHLLGRFSNAEAPSTFGSSMLNLVTELHDHCVAGYESTG